MAFRKYRPAASTKNFVSDRPVEDGYEAPTLMKPQGHGPIPIEAVLRPDSDGKRKMGITSVTRGIDYRWRHFAGFEMYLAGFRQAVFVDCLFEDMSFSGCHFSDVRFINCVFLGVQISRSYFRKCSFEGCSFGGLEISASRLAKVDFLACAGDRQRGVIVSSSTGYATRFVDCRVLPRCSRPRDVGMYLVFEGDAYRPVYAIGTSQKSFASVWGKIGAASVDDLLVLLDELAPLVGVSIPAGYDQLLGAQLAALRRSLSDPEVFAEFAEKSGISSPEAAGAEPSDADDDL